MKKNLIISGGNGCGSNGCGEINSYQGFMSKWV